MQGNAAQGNKSGFLGKLLLREVEAAKSGGDKPAKPLSLSLLICV